MKKTVYTLAFVALFSLTNKAQTPKTEEQKPAAKEQVNPDGTLKKDEKTDSKTETKPEKAPTRMAISEKGVPTAKPKAASKAAAPAGKTETQSTDKK